MNYYDIIKKCGKYVQDGIMVNDVKMPFTMLDYYSLLIEENMEYLNYHDIKSLCYEMKRRYNISNTELNRFLYFLEQNYLVGENVNNAIEVVNCNYSFIFDDKRFTPSYEDIQMIMNIFDVYEIPKHPKLIYQALHRLARDYPIFPLLVSEDEKKLGR